VNLTDLQDSATIEITRIDDTADESDEIFSITLSNPGNTSIGTIAEAVITIQDNDNAPTITPPSNTSGGGGGGVSVWLLLVLGGFALRRERKLGIEQIARWCSFRVNMPRIIQNQNDKFGTYTEPAWAVTRL
jgi:MYXO-CTERM domain-containing protein